MDSSVNLPTEMTYEERLQRFEEFMKEMDPQGRGRAASDWLSTFTDRFLIGVMDGVYGPVGILGVTPSNVISEALLKMFSLGVLAEREGWPIVRD